MSVIAVYLWSFLRRPRTYQPTLVYPILLTLNKNALWLFAFTLLCNFNVLNHWKQAVHYTGGNRKLKCLLATRRGQQSNSKFTKWAGNRYAIMHPWTKAVYKPPPPPPGKKNKLGRSSRNLDVFLDTYLTRAPLGYFYNAPHWGGAISNPPSDLRNYWTGSKNSSGIWKPWKNCQGKTNFIDLRVTSDVTGQVKVKMFDISGLVTSASKIAVLSTNKAD